MGQNDSHPISKHQFDPLEWTEKDQKVQVLTLENSKLHTQLKEISRKNDSIPRLTKKLQHTRGLLDLQRNENNNNVRRNTDLLQEIDDLRKEIVIKTRENQEKYQELESLHEQMKRVLDKNHEMEKELTLTRLLLEAKEKRLTKKKYISASNGSTK